MNLSVFRSFTERRAWAFVFTALGLMGQLSAQSVSSTTTSTDADEPVVKMDAFKVEGFREGLAKAREDQKNSVSLRDIVSVDAAGKLPDSNVAEALRRLPGAFLASDTRGGDGRFVSVRGIDPVLNNVTMNGQTLAVSDVDGRGGRAAPLDVLSSSALQSIEVIKSATPDMDGQGIGATINITAPSAFSHKGWFLYGSGKVGYNDLIAGGDHYEFDANVGGTFGARDQFGLVLGVNTRVKEYVAFEAAREGYRVFGRSPNQYFAVDGTPNPYGVLPVAGDLTLRSHSGRIQREGANAAFEWRPNQDTAVWLRGFMTDFRDTSRKSQLRLRTSNLAAATTRFLSPTRMFTTRGQVETETEAGEVRRPVDQLTLGGRRRFANAWTIEGNVTRTRAREMTPDGKYLLADEFANNNFQNGLGLNQANATYLIDVSQYFPVYQTVFDDPVRGWPGNGSIGDLSFYPFFRIRREFSRVQENTGSFDLNLKWEREFAGRPGFLKTGIKYLDREKSVDDRSLRFLPVSTVFLSDTYSDGTRQLPYGMMNQDIVGRFPLGPTDGLYGRYLGATHNIDTFRTVFAREVGSILDRQYNEITNTPNPATSIANPATWRFDEAGSRSNSVEDDYSLQEEILAYYVMGDYNLTPRLKLVGGARVEHTDASMSAFLFEDVRANGTFSLRPNGPVAADFTHVLPAVHLRWEASPRLLVRASFTTSVGRPDYKDMSPIGRSFEISAGPATNVFNGSLQEGNPALKPYEARNYDLSAAWYFSQGRGMISVGAFHKDIENAIYGFSYNPVTDDIAFLGKEFTRGTVNGISVVNFRGFQFASLGISTRANSPKSEVSGIEFTWQQDFTFLPAPFDGFGIAANLALMRSEATLPATRPGGNKNVPYFLQPDRVANVQLYFQRAGFEARAAWSYQDDALAVIGSDPLVDKYWHAREQLDAKVSYQVTGNWGVFVEGRNLTDEPNRTYFAFSRDSLGGQDSQPGYGINGRTTYFGVSYRFGE